MNLFRERFGALNNGRLENEESVTLPALLEMVNNGLSAQHHYTTAEAREALKVMDTAGEVVFAEDMIFRV